MYNVAFVLLRVADMYRQDGGGVVVTKLGQGGRDRSSTGGEDRSVRVSQVQQAGKSQE